MDLMINIKSYFEKYEDAFDNESIVLLRADGIPLYSKINTKTIDASTIGALTSGLWQAARALGAAHIDDKGHEFRLSFDTSGSGVYILPVRTKEVEFYLCALYENLINPALFKRNIQIIVNGLEETLKKNKKIINIREREHYLFENISDEEMDSLFNF